VFWNNVKLVSVDGYSAAVYDRDQKLINLSLTKDEKYRLFVPLSDISTKLIHATLVYEDNYFYYHLGFNPYSLIRGALRSIVNPKKPFGGSTLTMQLVRLTYGLNTRSIDGKLKQIILASLIELKFTKTEILEAYLNVAPYGANIEGIGAASLIYYGKSANKLQMEEAVSLAVLPQNPSRRWKDKGKGDLSKSRNRLIQSIGLVDGGKAIKPREFINSPASIPNVAPHFANRIKELNPERFHYYSSLDKNIQLASEGIITDALKQYKQLGLENATLIIAELPNMLVRSYIGSANYLDAKISGYVNGLEGKRSPGSLLKPFVYGLALEEGSILPETMLQDIPIRLTSYNPENFERNFLGPIPASQALVRSRNIPALEVFRKLNKTSFYEFLKKTQVRGLKEEDHYGIALVLGGLGITSEEIAGLYGVIGNEGVYKKLHFFDGDIPEKEERLWSSEVSYLLKDMLIKNPPPDGSTKIANIPWKTGTSYGSKDAWSAGIVGKYVVVLWFGNFDGKPNPNLVGRDIAGPVFFSIADYLASSGAGSLNMNTDGLSLKKIEVCAVTGALPNDYCTHKKESWFIKGVSPIDKCTLHQKVFIDPKDNLRVCPGESVNGATEKVYEVWDSGMLELYKSSGLKRNLPPPYKPTCGIKSSSSSKLRIVNPEEHLEYFIEAHRSLEIEFVASVPGEASTVSWFVNDELISTVEIGKPVIWKARAGRFNVRAVDNLGNSDGKVIRVSSLTE
jgi:penicillin-binding protein 1C